MVQSLEVTNITSLDGLIAAAQQYKAAMLAGAIFEKDLHALYNSAFDVFGCDELYDAAHETAPATEDLFGNPIGSMAERRASAAFDLGKAA